MIACTRRIPSNWNTTAFWLKSGSGTPYWVSGDSRELIAVRSTRVPFFFLLFFSFFFFFVFGESDGREGWTRHNDAVGPGRTVSREFGFSSAIGAGSWSRDESVDVRSDGGLQWQDSSIVFRVMRAPNDSGRPCPRLDWNLVRVRTDIGGVQWTRYKCASGRVAREWWWPYLGIGKMIFRLHAIRRDPTCTCQQEWYPR